MLSPVPVSSIKSEPALDKVRSVYLMPPSKLNLNIPAIPGRKQLASQKSARPTKMLFQVRSGANHRTVFFPEPQFGRLWRGNIDAKSSQYRACYCVVRRVAHTRIIYYDCVSPVGAAIPFSIRCDELVRDAPWRAVAKCVDTCQKNRPSTTAWIENTDIVVINTGHIDCKIISIGYAEKI